MYLSLEKQEGIGGDEVYRWFDRRTQDVEEAERWESKQHAPMGEWERGCVCLSLGRRGRRRKRKEDDDEEREDEKSKRKGSGGTKWNMKAANR